jgi:CheY-like chemotaxis protein
MTEEEKSRIFDPFFTTKPEGHGLGLAVVHGIVQSHKGAISVVSAPGKGTTFEVLLRPATDSNGDLTLCPRATTEKGPAVSGTVLLVEDEEALRLAAGAALGKKGFSVLSAANGLAAVEIFRARATDVDVVVLDLTLPGLSGQEVFRQLRQSSPISKSSLRVLTTQAWRLLLCLANKPLHFYRSRTDCLTWFG